MNATRAIQVLGRRDLEALHPARERQLVVGLDEQVDVVALDADVHDPKHAGLFVRELAPRDRDRRFAQGFVHVPLAQGADLADDPQHDMHGLIALELRARLVWGTGTRALRWTAQLHAERAPPLLRARLSARDRFALENRGPIVRVEQHLLWFLTRRPSHSGVISALGHYVNIFLRYFYRLSPFTPARTPLSTTTSGAGQHTSAERETSVWAATGPVTNCQPDTCVPPRSGYSQSFRSLRHSADSRALPIVTKTNNPDRSVEQGALVRARYHRRALAQDALSVLSARGERYAVAGRVRAMARGGERAPTSERARGLEAR
jgi:hypothetical protein